MLISLVGFRFQRNCRIIVNQLCLLTAPRSKDERGIKTVLVYGLKERGCWLGGGIGMEGVHSTTVVEFSLNI